MLMLSPDELNEIRRNLKFDYSAKLAIDKLCDHIREQAEALRKANEALAEARELIEWATLDGHLRHSIETRMCDWLKAHPAPTADLSKANTEPTQRSK
jgi:hypothetical protein